MHTKTPKRIIVESEVAGSPLVAALRRNLPGAEFVLAERVGESGVHDPDALEIVNFRGRFLKSCPGTRHYHCCGYQILHFGMQCTLGCTYCILQAYLNQPNLRLFGNFDAMLGEVAAGLESAPEVLHRIGTGEFTDSLLLDPWTEFSRTVVPFFAKRPNAVLELKTKTVSIGNLEGLDHGGRTITAWSLNSEAIWRQEESKTAPLAKRIEAARHCASLGYSLAFHFDPMIEHPGWRQGYSETLDRLFDSVDPARIVWISLGAFRFMPALKAAVQAKRPQSRILTGEFIHGLDGKMRYFRDIRMELYSLMVDRIRRADPGICVYLCMEGSDVWREVFGFSPDEKGGLSAMLDRAVFDRMNIRLPASAVPSARPE